MSRVRLILTLALALLASRELCAQDFSPRDLTPLAPTTHFLPGSKWLGKIPENIPFDELQFSLNGGHLAFKVSLPQGKSAWQLNGRQLRSYDSVERIWIGTQGDYVYLAKSGGKTFVNRNGLQSAAFTAAGDLFMTPDGSQYYFWACTQGILRTPQCSIYHNGVAIGEKHGVIRQLAISKDGEHYLAQVSAIDAPASPVELIVDGNPYPIPQGLSLQQVGIDRRGNPFFSGTRQSRDGTQEAFVYLNGRRHGPYERVQAVYTQSADLDYFHAYEKGASVLVFKGKSYPVSCFGYFSADRYLSSWLHECRLSDGNLETIWNGKRTIYQSRFAFLHGSDFYLHSWDGSTEGLWKNGAGILLANGNLFGASISPDGKRNALALKTSSGQNLIAVDSKADRAFPEGTGFPEFSPDGKTVLYIGFENGKQKLVKNGKPSGTAWDQIIGISPRAHNDHQYRSAFIYSEDGSTVGYYARKDNIIWWVVERVE